MRRRFLDLLGCQLSRSIMRLLREYQRALKQRNETLTRAFMHARGRTGASIAREPWTERVATLGSDLCVRRAALVDSLRDAVRELARDAFPKAGDVDVEYAPAVPWEDGQAGPALAAALGAGRGQGRGVGLHDGRAARGRRGAAPWADASFGASDLSDSSSSPRCS